MVDNILPLVGRTKPLFDFDIASRESEITDIIHNSKFLVIGGAGTIGSAIHNYPLVGGIIIAGISIAMCLLAGAIIQHVFPWAVGKSYTSIRENKN